MKTVSTDESGVYEFVGVAPGDYTLQMLVPENQLVGFFGEKSDIAFHLEDHDLVEHNFELFWNGRIQGRVTDDSGKPAHAWVQLRNADGSQVPGYVRFFLQTNRDGSYQYNKVPAGRYQVVVNPSGPYDEWPFDMQYYPTGVKATDALVLPLAEGQLLEGIDFKAPRLAERPVEVHVKWPNGNPATNAPVCTAYEHTLDYEPMIGRECYSRTDQHGMAVVHVYGNTHVRLFAEQFDDGLKTYHSPYIEAVAGKMPSKVDLVLTMRQP